MLRTRVLVAVLTLPVVIVVVLTGGNLYQIVVAGLLAIGASELVHLAKTEGYAPSVVVALVTLGAILGSVRWPAIQGPGLALAVLLAMGVTLFHFQHGDQAPLNSFAITLGAGMYLGWLGAYLLRLRLLPSGEAWVLFVLFTTFAADTGAYAIGKPFGRHKLAPRISPKKSWEGYVGGALTGALFGLAVGAFGQDALPGITTLHGLFIGSLIGVITPVGDLFVSALKREANVKDSSHLIPGHGGMLDRLDSVLVAAVLGYFYILWFV